MYFVLFQFDTLYQGDKNALSRARADMASLQVKNERVTEQVSLGDIFACSVLVGVNEAYS